MLSRQRREEDGAGARSALPGVWPFAKIPARFCLGASRDAIGLNRGTARQPSRERLRSQSAHRPF